VSSKTDNNSKYLKYNLFYYVFELLPEGVMLFDKNCNMRYANAFARRLITCNPHTFIDNTLEALQKNEGYSENKIFFNQSQKAIFQIQMRELYIASTMIKVVYLYNIDKQKWEERQLRNARARFIEEQLALRNKDYALHEIINITEDKKTTAIKSLKNKIDKNIKPILKKCKSYADPDLRIELELLEETLDNLTEHYASRFESLYKRLSPREKEICALIKKGLPSREIARILKTSSNTVVDQRRSIRRKLGLSNKKINLTTFLQSHANYITSK